MKKNKKAHNDDCLITNVGAIGYDRIPVTDVLYALLEHFKLDVRKIYETGKCEVIKK